MVSSSRRPATTDASASDEEKYVEIAYLADELPSDLSTFDVVADTELLHRFGDCKLMNPEIDPSSTPPMASWEWAVEGEKFIDYDPAMIIIHEY
jgi:hypothetical protein